MRLALRQRSCCPFRRSFLPLIRLLLLTVALGGSSCRDGCTGEPAQEGPPLLSRVPADALGVLLVPRVDRLSTQLKQLVQRLQPRFPDLNVMVQDARARLGFDPLDPATLEDLGLDPQGTLLVAAHRDWLLLGLTARSPGRFEEMLRTRVERESPGELEFRETLIGEQRVLLVVPKQPGAPPLLALAAVGRHVLVVPGRNLRGQPTDPAAALTTLLALPATGALSARPGFETLLSATGSEPGLQLWLNTGPLAREAAEQARRQGEPDGARLLDGLAVAVTNFACGLELSAEGLRLQGRAQLEPKQQALMQEHLAASRPAPDFTARLDPQTVLVLRGGVNPRLIWRLAHSYLPPAQRTLLDQQLTLLKQDGPDLEADLPAALSGNWAFAFRGVDLAAVMGQMLSGARKDPDLSSFETATWLQLADAPRAVALLTRLWELLAAAGTQVQQQEQQGVKQGTVQQGEQVLGRWLQGDDLLVLTTGPRGAEQAAAALRGTPGATLAAAVTDPRARRALGPAGMAGLWLSFPNLQRSLPILAMTLPQANVMLGELKELTLVLESQPDGLGGELGLSLQAAAP